MAATRFLRRQVQKKRSVLHHHWPKSTGKVGTGKLQHVEGKIDPLKYQEILGENVMSSVRKLKLGRHWTFQQDNNPKHTSNSSKTWLQKKSWKILQWPSQSPDLNPIENLWWDLKEAVAAHKPKNTTELEAIAHDECARFLRSAARIWCLVIHIVCSRSLQQNGVLLNTKVACHERVESF